MQVCLCRTQVLSSSGSNVLNRLYWLLVAMTSALWAVFCLLKAYCTSRHTDSSNRSTIHMNEWTSDELLLLTVVCKGPNIGLYLFKAEHSFLWFRSISEAVGDPLRGSECSRYPPARPFKGWTWWPVPILHHSGSSRNKQRGGGEVEGEKWEKGREGERLNRIRRGWGTEDIWLI